MTALCQQVLKKNTNRYFYRFLLKRTVLYGIFVDFFFTFVTQWMKLP